MKKWTLIVLLLSLVQVIQAQEETKENEWVIGGSTNFLIQNNTYPLTGLSITSGIGGIYSNTTNDTKNTIFAISPYIGKQINTRLLLGLQLDYRLGNYKVEEIRVSTFPSGPNPIVDFQRQSNQFGVGIFSRYLFNPTKSFNFFLQPYLEYNMLREEESQGSVVTQEEKVNFIELGIGLGMLYNINDRLRATLRSGGVSYVNGKWEVLDTNTERTFSSLGMSFNLSTIYFGFEIKL